LCFLKQTWFWLGIWVFFYLRFTNYAGIGLLESIMIITFTVSEIPSGAIADLLGKKNTLIVSFLLQSIGNIVMGFTPNFMFLGLGIFIACIGGALYSGTMEALVYDSLIDEKKEKHYDKAIANMSTIQLIASALASIIGGFMYTINPSLPFHAVGLAYFIGFILSFFLKEPLVDTEKFSLKNFIQQTKEGVKQLFGKQVVKNQTIMVLSTAMFTVIVYEMLNDILAVEFGFSETQLGIFVAVTYLVSAAASQFTPQFRKKIGDSKGLLLMGTIIAISLLISPFVSLILGAISILIRFASQSVYDNFISIIVNKNTESKYRATTLSTFNMVKNMPYVLTAFILGSFIDSFSARNIAFVLGVLLSILVALQFLKLKTRKSKQVIIKN